MVKCWREVEVEVAAAAAAAARQEAGKKRDEGAGGGWASGEPAPSRAGWVDALVSARAGGGGK